MVLHLRFVLTHQTQLTVLWSSSSRQEIGALTHARTQGIQR